MRKYLTLFVLTVFFSVIAVLSLPPIINDGEEPQISDEWEPNLPVNETISPFLPDEPPNNEEETEGIDKGNTTGEEVLEIPMGLYASLRRYASDHILVKFKKGFEEEFFPLVAAASGASLIEPMSIERVAKVYVGEEQSVESLLNKFRESRIVEWAELDYYAFPAIAGVLLRPEDINDPLYPLQWHLKRIGFEEALRRNPSAGEGITIAVIDTGVSYGDGNSFPSMKAPDLETAKFVNGWDFVDNDPFPYDEGSLIPESIYSIGHGTFVATEIAAGLGNGLAGVGISPNVSIMPIRVLDTDGFGLYSWIAEGIRYAADHGADVINLSLGGLSSSQVLQEAVIYAYNKGITLVAAAGNLATKPEFNGDVLYPAKYPQVIAVGATSYRGGRASYSNYGPNIFITAPAGETSSSIVDNNKRDAVLSVTFVIDTTTGEVTYGAFWFNGTSFATPQVSAAVALIRALGVTDNEAIKLMLRETAIDRGLAGFDEHTGHGELNLERLHKGIGFN